MIRLITGTMTSGKSERLIQEIDQCEGSYLILKPSLDTRDGDRVRTRAHERTYPAVLVDESNTQLVDLILSAVGKYYTVFLDETQFFSKEFITKLIKICSYTRTDIVASGLTKDFKGNRFPAMSVIWQKVTRDNVTILFGRCYQCNNDDASVDVLMDNDNKILTEGETVQIEGTQGNGVTQNHYESLCGECYEVLK